MPEDITNEPSDDFEQIESMDSASFLGGVDATEEEKSSEEANVVDDAADEKTDQVDNESTDQNTEDAEEEDAGTDEPMTQSQRNAYFAQQRIAAKQSNDSFVEKLRSETKDYADDVDESKFENMDEETAEILKEAHRAARLSQANEAIRDVERSRENVANSLIMAESQLPAFNPNDKQHYVGEELYSEAMSDWAAAYAVIEKDSAGEAQIVGVKPNAPSPYEYLERKSNHFMALSDKLAARAQANVARNNASHEIVPVQQSSRSDSFDDLEERVGNISLT